MTHCWNVSGADGSFVAQGRAASVEDAKECASFVLDRGGAVAYVWRSDRANATRVWRKRVEGTRGWESVPPPPRDPRLVEMDARVRR